MTNFPHFTIFVQTFGPHKVAKTTHTHKERSDLPLFVTFTGRSGFHQRHLEQPPDPSFKEQPCTPWSTRCYVHPTWIIWHRRLHMSYTGGRLCHLRRSMYPSLWCRLWWGHFHPVCTHHGSTSPQASQG